MIGQMHTFIACSALDRRITIFKDTSKHLIMKTFRIKTDCAKDRALILFGGDKYEN